MTSRSLTWRSVARTGCAPLRAVAAAAVGAVVGAALAWKVYHPDREHGVATPADHGLEYENWTWLTRRDHVPVAAWFIPGAGLATVVVCHGMGRSRQAVLPHITLLHEAGFHVLAYDMRNHGETGGTWHTSGMAARFTSDVVDAVAAARRDPRSTGPLAVLAFSFSTWAAVDAARRFGASIDAVVCDSGPVADIGAAFARLARLKAGALPPLARGGVGERAMVASCKWTGQAMLAVGTWPPRRPGAPLLLVGGGRDRILPGDEVAALADAVPDAISWIAPQALHTQALRGDRAGYVQQVIGFLRINLVSGRDAVEPAHE